MIDLSELKEEIESLENSQARVVILTGVLPLLYDFIADEIGRKIGKKTILLFFNNAEDLNQFGESVLENAKDSNQVKGFQIRTNKGLDGKQLTDLGYERVSRVWNPGEFSLYGDVVICWIEGYDKPLRISLLGSEVEEITLIDSETRRTVEVLNEVDVLPAIKKGSEREDKLGWGLVQDSIVGNSEAKESSVFYFAVLREGLPKVELEKMHFPLVDLGFSTLPLLDNSAGNSEVLKKILQQFAINNYRIKYIPSKPGRRSEIPTDLKPLISEIVEKKTRGKAELKVPSKGFISRSGKEVVLTDYEVFGEVDLSLHEFDASYPGTDSKDSDKKAKIATKELLSKNQELFKKILPGDYVVHQDHGVGQYNGIAEREEGAFIELKYAGKDRLYVPLNQAKKITKYIGTGGTGPVLTSLNSGVWRRIRKRAAEDAEKLAKELVRLYALRKVSKISSSLPEDINIMNVEKFVNSFEYSDTEDQHVATDEIVRDLSADSPMDRLLVGDVAFGKTEVALRAIFAVLDAGYQVALLAPTTVLVEQHLGVAQERFNEYDFRMAAVSRFLTRKQEREIFEKVESGEIQLVIGTHKLLSEDVKFKKLGLIVIDEEQKFGVEQKEKLKSKRLEAHVLSMSATPIPRTLNMSLMGIRDISIIATPPLGRKPVKNSFAKFEQAKVNKAIIHELERDGQVYYLHNRVRDIDEVALNLTKYFPSSRIEVGHGQMSPDNLSKVMHDFSLGKIDILVCTTIIENGLDLPNVNTLVVDDATRFGLSQLYQIRGRIGRSDRQGFAHFFYRNLPGDAGARLDALAESEELGSGFVLANRDLEIRGAGNLLGRDQSGVIQSVGYGMYIGLLGEKIDEIKEKANL